MVATSTADVEVREAPARPTPRSLALAPKPASVARYEADPARCVVEAVLRWRRVALWRVRLRAITAELTLPAAADVPATLTAQLSVRPSFVSIPATGGLFLPDVARDQRIGLAALALPPTLAEGATDTSPAVLTIGADSWAVALAVETVLNDGERVIAAISGAIPRRVPIPFPGCSLHIDAAVEFRRWG